MTTWLDGTTTGRLGSTFESLLHAPVLPNVVADGITDNYAIIQTALINGGVNGEVILPPGRISITSPLVIPNGMGIRGLFNSPGTFSAAAPVNNLITTTLVKSGNGDTVQIPPNSTRGTIKGICMDGNNNIRTSGSLINIMANVTAQESQFIVENCFLREAPTSCVLVGANARAARLINCELYNDAQSTGPALSVAGSDFSALACLITNFGSTTNDAVYLNGSTTKLDDCDIWGSRYGVFIQSGNNHSLIACGMDTHQKNAIYVADPADAVAIQGVIFHSNSLEGDGFNAHIKSDSTGQVTVSGCSFGPLDSGVTNRVGYSVEKGASASIPWVAGCTFNTAAQTQPTIANAARAQVANVTVTSGTGTPESVVTGRIGDQFNRLDGGATTSFYVKTSGTGNTGWTAK